MVLIGVILIVLLLVWLWWRTKGISDLVFVKEEGDKWYVNSIGNVLCSYFYRMGNAWSIGERFVWGEQFKNEFYRNLPKELDPPVGSKIPPYKNNRDFENLSAWICDTEDSVNFWNAMKPYVHKIIGEALERSGLKMIQRNPVIHFRCSDVPFRKSEDYHFQKYKFFKQSLGKENKVDLITCNTHLAEDGNQSACEKYVRLLVEYLNPIEVDVTCSHYFIDFAKMYYAPKVVSTGSSMSFMAGYFGNGEFVTAGHFSEGSSNQCKICKYSGVDISHSEIENYYDVDSVHKKLVD